MTLTLRRTGLDERAAIRTSRDSLPRQKLRGPRTGLLPLLALVIPILASGCGSGDDDASSQPVSTPTAADSEQSGDDGVIAPTEAGGPVAEVTVAGVTYRFAGDNPICRESFGALFVGLPLAEIDGAAAPEDAGFFDMTLYPTGEDDQSAITVELPDGRLLAGYNEIGLSTSAVALERDGLSASGKQTMSAHSGAQSEATIQVTCG